MDKFIIDNIRVGDRVVIKRIACSYSYPKRKLFTGKTGVIVRVDGTSLNVRVDDCSISDIIEAHLETASREPGFILVFTDEIDIDDSVFVE